MIKTWSKTQGLIALSSGESEFYAALKASAEGLGLIAMLRDFGVHVNGKVLGDASAALGIIHRRGLGRTRHIDTGLLWIQQTAPEKRLEYAKVLGAENPADLLTKYLTAEVINRHCSKLDTTFEEGRAEAAPQLSALYISKAIWEMEEEESEEQNEDVEWAKLQCVVNEVWHNKWRHTVNNILNKNEGHIEKSIQEEPDEDNIPPLVPLPQADIYKYAKETGLISCPSKHPKGPRGPTAGSTGPAPITCII